MLIPGAYNPCSVDFLGIAKETIITVGRRGVTCKSELMNESLCL